MTYYSKIDPWVLVLLIGIPCGFALLAFFLSSVYMALICFFILAFYLLFVFPVSYRFDQDALKIRCGVLRSSIP